MVKHIQTIRRQFVDELIVFDHFVKLALKVLMRNTQHTWIEQLMKMYCQRLQRSWCRCLYWMEKMYNTRVSKRKVKSEGDKRKTCQLDAGKLLAEPLSAFDMAGGRWAFQKSFKTRDVIGEAGQKDKKISYTI